MMPVDLDRIERQLTFFEDRRKFPYKDRYGNLTIGIGHNLTALGLSDKVIDLIFIEDVESAWSDLAKFHPEVNKLSEVRQRVLLDMTFNMGISSFNEFHEFHRLWKSGKFEAAAADMLTTKYAHDVGLRAITLSNMLKYDKDIIEFGRERKT